MKRVLLIWLFLIVGPVWGFDLSEAMNAARECDPQWLAAQAQFVQAQEKVPQARAQLLPALSASANTMRNNQTIYYPDINQTQSGEFGTHQVNLNLKVPLWEQQNWAGLTEAHQQVQQAEQELAAANADLSRRLVQAYADVLSARETFVLNQSLQAAYAFQLDQAQARFEHGAATIVDADQARAKADQAAADVIDARNVMAVKRSGLTEIIGSLAGDPEPLTPDYRPDKLTPATLAEWQALALQNNSDYRAKAKAVDVALTEIKRQHDAYLPTVELVGTYSKNGQGNSALMGQTGTVIHQSQIGVQISVPLYSGGSTSSSVRQAAAVLTRAQDTQEKTQRQLMSAITQAYLGVSNGRAAIQAREKAVHSAQTSLQSALTGLQHGMKTQLDLLQAQQQLASAQKDYTKAQLDTLVSDINLNATAGMLNEAALWSRISQHVDQ